MEKEFTEKKIEWTRENVFGLIDMWEQNPCLYDPKNKFYSNKHARFDALTKICEKLRGYIEHITPEDVKTKLNNLRSQYNHELTKQKKSEKSGAGTDDIYQPSAFWFGKLHFLKRHMKPRKGKSNFEVRTSDVQYIRTVDNLIASKISMKLHLQSSHFASGGGGHTMNSISSGVNNGIILKCTAQIGNLYHETAEIELGIPQRDPIPARVTSSNASRLKDVWRNLTSTLRSTTGTLPAVFISIVVTAAIHHINYTVR